MNWLAFSHEILIRLIRLPRRRRVAEAGLAQAVEKMLPCRVIGEASIPDFAKLESVKFICPLV